MKPITFVNETPAQAPWPFRDWSAVTVCLRTDTNYVKKPMTGQWVKKRLDAGKFTLGDEDLGPDGAALKGDWKIAQTSWGIEFNGPGAVLILDLAAA